MEQDLILFWLAPRLIIFLMNDSEEEILFTRVSESEKFGMSLSCVEIGKIF